MKVQLRTIVRGPELSLDPGEHDLPDELAKRLIAAGAAVVMSPGGTVSAFGDDGVVTQQSPLRTNIVKNYRRK